MERLALFTHKFLCIFLIYSIFPSIQVSSSPWSWARHPQPTCWERSELWNSHSVRVWPWLWEIRSPYTAVSIKWHMVIKCSHLHKKKVSQLRWDWKWNHREQRQAVLLPGQGHGQVRQGLQVDRHQHHHLRGGSGVHRPARVCGYWWVCKPTVWLLLNWVCQHSRKPLLQV